MLADLLLQANFPMNVVRDYKEDNLQLSVQRACNAS